MKPIVLFVVGPPAAGKTTLVRALIGKQTYLVPGPKWTVEGVKQGIIAAGHYNGGVFDGADTVPYNGVTDALEYWAVQLNQMPLTIFDGDRFSNRGVLDFFTARALVRGVHLDASAAELDRRRSARGSNQNAAWMKGRATKAARFADMIPGCLRLDERSGDVAELVRRYLRDDNPNLPFPA